jgi:hypothetical protein
MLLALSLLGTSLVAFTGAYIFGRTRAPARYDVWDARRQCPTCGKDIFPGGEGMTPICWPCNSRRPMAGTFTIVDAAPEPIVWPPPRPDTTKAYKG